MIKFKNTVLCTIVSLGLVSVGSFASALQTENQNNVNAYVELGASFGLLDESKESNLLGKTTIKNPDFGFNGGLGLRINNFSLGVDVSVVNSDIVYDSYYTSIDDGTLPMLDMTLVIPKFGAEHVFNNHNTLYGSIGLGCATYDVEDAKSEATYAPTNTKPAFAVELGYKLYAGEKKGIFLSLGTRYTRVLINDLNINVANTHTSLSKGLDIIQVGVKVGYQF